MRLVTARLPREVRCMNYLHWDFTDTDQDVKELNREFLFTVGIFTAVICAVLIIGTIL